MERGTLLSVGLASVLAVTLASWLILSDVRPGRPVLDARELPPPAADSAARIESRLAPLHPALKVDQLGFPSWAPKSARLSSGAAEFRVVSLDNGQVVFSGQPTQRARQDRASGDAVYEAEFSALQLPGRYVVEVPGFGRSQHFNIGDSVYNPALRTVLRGFYLQRSGAQVVDALWGHPPCHLDDALIWDGGPTERRLEVAGGWHDAGDYGKYVASAGITVGLLLSAYENYPDRFADGQSSIPENGNGVPDLLDEVRYELEWLLKMQRPNGAVYHKVNSLDWPAAVPPELDRSPRYVFPVSSVATANVAAVMAVAARVYRPIDAAFAATAWQSAERAWRYLEANPGVVPAGGFKNPAGVSTAEGDNRDDRDERFWAAAELLRTSGEERYARAARSLAQTWTPAFAESAHGTKLQNLAALTYLAIDGPQVDQKLRARLTADLLDVADRFRERVERDGYGSALSTEGKTEYFWGSNGIALQHAILLLHAERLRPEQGYAEAALSQLHYIFGRNALGKSFVSGVGADPVSHPHHRPSMAIAPHAPVPGLLSGGPNVHDASALSDRPQRAYVDQADSYSTNETSIDLNAALVFVLARFAAPAGCVSADAPTEVQTCRS